MFTKKSHADIKKSTAKLQDSKKDSASRLRHLRTILDNVDHEEAKSLFETNYSHVYFILYDTFVQAETNLKQKVHKAHREELDGSLWLLEKILCLLPELLARRWQCHSLSRIMAKLLHLGNSPKLRREGVKYFLLWYQTLGEKAPSYVHAMYADLIPGLIVPQKGGIGPDTDFTASDFLTHPNMKADGGMASVFHDNTFSHPVQCSEIVALLPPSSSERSAPPDPRDGLEVLLNSMVQTTACLRWRDNRAQKDHRAFAFLLQRFKEVFLPVFSPNFESSISIYDPRLDMPTMRTINKKEEVMASCVVVLINWVSRFTHERLLSHRLDCALHIEDVDHVRLQGYQQGLIVRDVFYETRENVNFVHEVYRQAFLLNFTSKPQIEAIRTSIAVYRDWMTGSTPPPFLLEPDDAQNAPNHAHANAGGTPRSQRLRTPSYVGAIQGSKENVAVRAGMQNVLQVFVTNAANVFLVNTANLNICFPTRSRDHDSSPLMEQTEICKKVLNVYRAMVMNTRMEPRTWEQLLLVLLQVTSVVLHQNPPPSGAKSPNLGGILGSAIFQTLIVTWIRAHTNVPVNPALWEKFLTVLQSLTHREELIVEWNKTMQTLTRVFSRYTYGINLLDLPLDRVAESRGKRRRIGSVWHQSGVGTGGATIAHGSSSARDKERDSIAESNSSRSDETSQGGGAAASQLQSSSRTHQHSQSHGGGGTGRAVPLTPMLSRSYSEGSLASAARNSRVRRRRNQTPKVVALPPPPTIPSSVEHSLNTLLARPSNVLKLEANLMRTHSNAQDMRRALSLDSLAPSRKTRRLRRGSQDLGDEVDGDYRTDCDNESGGGVGGSRSPSPTASSGIEGSSIKDAHIQLDVLAVDSGSLEDGNSGSYGVSGADRRSIILGGTATGWLPDSTSIMWKRMLGALGDVNRIPKPELHAQVFKHLLEMTQNLIKIKQNQGISTDNQSTPPPPILVPPISIVAPWCYGALTLDRSFKKGKLWAVQLLCELALQGGVSGMQQLPVFYHAMHKLLTGEDRDLIYAILKHLQGPRLLSLLLPGHTLLLLDIVHASALLLTSLEVNRSTPRADVAALLGSLLCYPASLLPRPVLQPTPQQFTIMECPDLQDHILNIVLRCARREPSAKARCIALSQLGQWILLRLSQSSQPSANQRGPFQQTVPHPKGAVPKEVSRSFNPRIREALQVLLQALQFKHHTIAVIAVDSLKLCAERGQELAAIERAPQLIITALCKALEIQNVSKPKDADKVVMTSLMLCLGEYCMAFPMSLMLAPINEQGDTLVLQVLRVLLQVSSGAPRHERVKLTADDDFDMHTTHDDLQGDGRLPEASYQTSETIQACITAIRLCAKAVAMHLVTHMGHFPMGIGASRLSSMVEEQDDTSSVSGGSQMGTLDTRRDSVELPSVVNAQNMQLFMLNPGLVASFIELPTLKLPGGGITAGLVTAEKQVRVLMRDLNGKACWDASILYSEPRKPEQPVSLERYEGSAMGTAMHGTAQPLDSIMSSMVGVEQQAPRHTLRHRPPGVLPLAEDMAPDMDQLDDMLAYIGYTSPECLPPGVTQLNAPGPSPLSSSQEAEGISVILNQRALEQEFVARAAQQPPPTALRHATSSSSLQLQQHDQRSLHSASADQHSHASFDSYSGTGTTGGGSLPSRNETPFQYCRLLFSHLGLAGWERRSRTHLLERSEKLIRELRNVDLQKCRETHKVAVIYVAAGQEDKSSILRNASGSSMYEMFVSALGWEIDLETHNGFLGGLPRQGCGATAPYYATPFLEVIYHVATRMPSDSEALLLKTRHLGNDEVHIVWSEHHRDYRRDILPTEFCDVLIVVYPLRNGLFRVTVNRKPEVPWFGPLANESVLSGTCLATLVRATAINASRTKRAALPLYQQYYEERNRSLDSVSSRYKESTTFEDFASRIYNPMPLSTLDTLHESGDSSSATTLAAALVDHNRSSIKGWVQASIDSTYKDVPLGIVPSASAGSTAAMEASTLASASPRGSRKSGSTFKIAPKKHSLQQSGSSTPPESPTFPMRRFK
ncbi:probable Rho GTPase-activating protein CG5521 isoform X2 [Scaptodrosophila lebanonensis]|uniref:Probable Rho GTPase-activating protein CG5521 isoform X2 n=1 Tax=Drosophila lebanonensis TaxID=7225 RepID=A0A6J2T324_DROLE|nr:probable Rho GTPase-activating protein CG5521 isoform X2 [Scaptodrosophila lebanonensis]